MKESHKQVAVCSYEILNYVGTVHTITEWLRLEGTLKVIELQPNAMAWLLPTSSGCPIQPGLGHLQGWGIHSFSGQFQHLNTL